MVSENVNSPTKTARLHPSDWPAGFELAIGRYTADFRSDKTTPIPADCPYCGTQLIAWPEQTEINRVISVAATPYENDGTIDCVLEQVDAVEFLLTGCPVCKTEFIQPRELLNG